MCPRSTLHPFVWNSVSNLTLCVCSVGCTEGPDSFFRLQDNRNRITVKAFLWKDAEYRPGQTGSEWTLRGASLISEHNAFLGPGDREIGPWGTGFSWPSIHLSHLWWCLMEYSLTVYLSRDYHWRVSLKKQHFSLGKESAHAHYCKYTYTMFMC